MSSQVEKFLISEKAFALLNLLKKSKNKWQLPAELTNTLKIRREALFEAVDELDKVGYPLEIHPYFGLRLIGLPNSFVPGEITENLNVSSIGKSLKLLSKTASTVKAAFELLEKDEATDGMVVIADEIEETDTWKNHNWFSQSENELCIAVILKLPMLLPDKQGLLLAVGALSAAYTLTDNIHIPAKITYPNEITVYDKKIGAVLIEHNEKFPEHFVLAININVNSDIEDIPSEFAEKATSVKIELSEEINRNLLLRYLLFSLDNFVSKLRKRKFKPLTGIWLEYSNLFDKSTKKGKKIIVNTEAGEIVGTAKTLDPIEGLTLIINENEEKIIKYSEIESLKILKSDF